MPTRRGVPGGERLFCYLAAAAIVVAATAVAAAVVVVVTATIAAATEQDQQDDDPAPVTAKTVIAHTKYLHKKISKQLSPLIPRYSRHLKMCKHPVVIFLLPVIMGLGVDLYGYTTAQSRTNYYR